ncbi:Hypothetical predicted protein [Paramuricea clavata]|uniref:Uncharacterized protein n=1 Tax=Paramuricea clavata TaxID=317549 RepID=A0A6S7KCD0_PARCT|nr:Hypothetical predicted protein [Paramuricea clavata]
MLLRGTYKQIVHAAWTNNHIKSSLIELMIKDVEKDSTKLCSKKNPSILRTTDKQCMLSFSMEKVSDEIKERAPIFHSVLSAASINSRSKATKEKSHFGPTAMAAAVCLKSRSRYMTANTLARLGPLKLTTSHTYVYKKLDEFGIDYYDHILESVKRQGEFLKQQQEQKTSVNPELAKSHQNRNLIVPDVGRKLVFDNMDYRHEVHYMTEEHQSVDNHCATVMAVENHVSGSHFSGVLNWKMTNAFHLIVTMINNERTTLFWVGVL